MLIVGVPPPEMFTLPLTNVFSVSLLAPRSIADSALHCAADSVTASTPLLPVRFSTAVSVPVLKSTVVAFVSTTVSVLAPPLIDSVAAKSPLAR